MAKTKIVLDADVIIHFSKGGCLSSLSKIFPEYDYIVLDIVLNELKGDIRKQLENQVLLIKDISIIKFSPTSEMLREYARLIINRGKGESACMSYCLYNHDVIGSSNICDIKNYCEEHKITYLTTVDFLYNAIKKGVMTIFEANTFIKDVVSKGSKLPENIDFEKFVGKVI